MELILESGASGSPSVAPPQANVALSSTAVTDMHEPSTGRETGAALAGDWAAYRRRCAFLEVVPALPTEAAIGARRAYALAYLGERAQLHGGVFRASRPTVFTEAAVAGMAKRNAAARFGRYPWLAEMLALMAALDTAQHGVMSREGNVFSFPDGFNSRA